MSRERTIKLTVLGDASSANRAFGSISKGAATTQSRLSRFGSGVKSAFSSAIPVIGGLAVAIGGMINEAAEAQKVQSQTRAVLKSTGKVANVTAKDVETLSLAIRDLTGFSDEEVASAQNLLLTFTKVRNEAGKGNDVFEQTTRMAADMSVALGTDMRTNVMQLGKALNDPVRGLTTLRRVGVSFTEKQEEMIKKMVEAGDVMGAQKVILHELGREFGGSAKEGADDFATRWDVLKGKLGDVAEMIGTALMPYIEKLVNWLVKKLPDAIKWAKGFIKDLGEFIKDVAGFIQDLIDKWEEFVALVRPGDLGGELGTIAGEMAGSIARTQRGVKRGRETSDGFTGGVVPKDPPRGGDTAALRAPTMQPVVIIQGDVYDIQDFERKLDVVRRRRERRFGPEF